MPTARRGRRRPKAELQITPFCAPQRMDAEIADATQIGGYVRGRRQMVDHALRSASEREARTTLVEPKPFVVAVVKRISV